MIFAEICRIWWSDDHRETVATLATVDVVDALKRCITTILWVALFACATAWSSVLVWLGIQKSWTHQDWLIQNWRIWAEAILRTHFGHLNIIRILFEMWIPPKISGGFSLLCPVYTGNGVDIPHFQTHPSLKFNFGMWQSGRRAEPQSADPPSQLTQVESHPYPIHKSDESKLGISTWIGYLGGLNLHIMPRPSKYPWNTSQVPSHKYTQMGLVHDSQFIWRLDATWRV